ncbi:MAG: hypothetical protein EXQ71_00295 [Acidimicrobiia bacterium]|nr:hypothetical protein [Acidimicrobiia bacterium]
MIRPTRRGPLLLLLPLVAALASCTSDEGNTEAFCKTLANGQQYPSVFEGFNPTDANNALERLRIARGDLEELDVDAPREIRDDLRVEIDYVEALIDGVAALGAGADSDDLTATFQAVTTDHPKVPAAAAALETFATAGCPAG